MRWCRCVESNVSPVFGMADCINIWVNTGNKFTSTSRNHRYAWRQKLLISKGSDQGHYTCSKKEKIEFFLRRTRPSKPKINLTCLPYGVHEATNKKQTTIAAFAIRISADSAPTLFDLKDSTFIFFACSRNFFSWLKTCFTIWL